MNSSVKKIGMSVLLVVAVLAAVKFAKANVPVVGPALDKIT
jgi:hypothetical protein